MSNDTKEMDLDKHGMANQCREAAAGSTAPLHCATAPALQASDSAADPAGVVNNYLRPQATKNSLLATEPTEVLETTQDGQPHKRHDDSRALKARRQKASASARRRVLTRQLPRHICGKLNNSRGQVPQALPRAPRHGLIRQLCARQTCGRWH